MKNLKTLFLSIGIMFMAQSNVFASMIDCSPTQDIVACTGDDYVIYILDKKTLAVQKRIRTNQEVDLDCFWFSPDGKSFWYADYDNIHQLNTTTWETIKTIDFNGRFFINKDRSEFVCYKTYQKKLKGFNLNTGEPTCNYKVNTTQDIMSISFSFDGADLLLLAKPKDDATETKVKYEWSDLKEMTVEEKLEKESKGDGKSTNLIMINKATGEIKEEKTTWYSKFYNAQIIPVKNGYYIVNRNGVAFLDKKFNVVTLSIPSGASTYAYDYKADKLIFIDDLELSIYSADTKTSKIIDLEDTDMDGSPDYVTVRGGNYYYSYDNYMVGHSSATAVTQKLTAFY